MPKNYVHALMNVFLMFPEKWLLTRTNEITVVACMVHKNDETFLFTREFNVSIISEAFYMKGISIGQMIFYKYPPFPLSFKNAEDYQRFKL